MNKIKLFSICLLTGTCFSLNVLAQTYLGGQPYSPVVQSTGGMSTTQLAGGMTFGVNNSITSSQTFAKDFSQYGAHQFLTGGRIFAYGTELNIKGTRFLFDDWVKGEIVKNSGEVVAGDKYSFNFDKINNNLLVTIDKKEVIEVYKDSIQAFKFQENGKLYSFKKIPDIQKYRFVQVLSENKDKYSLYKTINTHFVGADYTTNGLTESGNPYDEYVDKTAYYIVYKGEVRPVILKFTAIKKALKEDRSKVKDYYADHLMDDVDENYLVNVVNQVNN